MSQSYGNGTMRSTKRELFNEQLWKINNKKA